MGVCGGVGARRMERDLPADGVFAWRVIRNAPADGALTWRTIRNAPAKALFVVRLVRDRARLSGKMALLDLSGCGFSYSISKTSSTRINANSVTWCFIHEKPALLGKTGIEYEKAQRCGRAGECAGLVIGLDVGLHVVANAGAPLGGGGIYRVCAPDPACRRLRSRSSVRRSTLRYRSRPAVCSLARRPRV